MITPLPVMMLNMDERLSAACQARERGFREMVQRLGSSSPRGWGSSSVMDAQIWLNHFADLAHLLVCGCHLSLQFAVLNWLG